MAKYETTHTAFLGVDLDLLENPIYSDMDVRAAMLYALYKDRAHLSLYSYTQLGNKRYIDENGVFIIFTNEVAAKALHTTTKMIGKFRKQLSDHGLIQIRRNGLKGYKIYVNEVQRTPKNVKLTLPWMNHYVEIKKSVSEWTLAAQIQHWNNMALMSKSKVQHESDVMGSTCIPNGLTSLTPSSLTTNSLNNNGLDDNAHARKGKLNPIQSSQPTQSKPINPYNTLPEKIKQSFVKTFGFVTKQVALELHTLIKQTDVDMVNYVVESAFGRKITSPIAYVKAAISNALKRGDRCVQDMINYYENNVKKPKVKRNTKKSTKPSKNTPYTREELDILLNTTEEEVRTYYPALFLKRLQLRMQKENRKPIIPIYKLGE